MQLVRFALKNPYTIIALAIGLSLLSLVLLPSIPVDILPDFKTPVIVSYYSYPGFPTGEMEKCVAERLERLLTLASRDGAPGIALDAWRKPVENHLPSRTDVHAAMNDIVTMETNDLFHLPPGIDFPFTLRSEPGSLPVVLAAVSGEGLSEKDLYQVAYYGVRNKMGGLKGVQVPHPFGGKYRQMMVYVDPVRLRSVGLSPKDVAEALRAANLVLGSGTAEIDRSSTKCTPSTRCPASDEIAGGAHRRPQRQADLHSRCGLRERRRRDPIQHRPRQRPA